VSAAIGVSSAAPAARAPDSMLRRIPEVLAYVGHVDSLLAIAVLAVLLSLLEWIGTLPFVLSGAVLLLARATWGLYFYLVTHKAARGSRRLPAPADYLDTWETLAQPLLQLTLALFWYAALVTAFAAVRVGIPDFIERYQARPMVFLSQQGVVGHVILAVGILHLPSAVLATLCRRGILRFLDPTLGVRAAACVQQAYLVAFALTTTLGLVGLTMDGIAAKLEVAMPIPLAAPVLGHMLRLWIPLAQSRLVGGFAYRNASHLREEDEE
jgi:succinate dehydrogenase hydrophobic anchor subunit